MRFNFLLLSAVLPVLLVAGAPVTNVNRLFGRVGMCLISLQEVELIARGAGKTAGTTTPAKSSAKSTLATGNTKKSCPARPAKKAAVSKLHYFDPIAQLDDFLAPW